jgi:hypothetical protein
MPRKIVRFRRKQQSRGFEPIRNRTLPTLQGCEMESLHRLSLCGIRTVLGYGDAALVHFLGEREKTKAV